MRLDPTEAEEAQCDAMISLAVDGSRCWARFPVLDLFRVIILDVLWDWYIYLYSRFHVN